MKLATLILVALLLVAALPTTQAGGRAACSVAYNVDWRARCFVEQTLFAVGPFEIAAGVFLEPHRSWVPYPYTMVGWFEEWWWATIEFGKPIDHAGIHAALSFGIRW